MDDRYNSPEEEQAQVAAQLAKKKKKRRRVWFWILMIFVVIPLVVSSLSEAFGSDDSGGEGTFGKKDLINMLGATNQEVVREFGQPLPDSMEDLILFYYKKGTDSSALTFMFGNDNTVNTITLTAEGYTGDWIVCGCKINDSEDKLANIMQDLGASANEMIDRFGNTNYNYEFGYNGGLYSLTSSTDGNKRIGFMLGYKGRVSSDSGSVSSDGASAAAVDIGGLLGCSENEVIQLLGEPLATEDYNGGVFWKYDSVGSSGYYTTLTLFDGRVEKMLIAVGSNCSVYGARAGYELESVVQYLVDEVGFVFIGIDEESVSDGVMVLLSAYDNETQINMQLIADNASGIIGVVYLYYE